MELHSKNRETFIDILKGIGIISIVIGHGPSYIWFGKVQIPIGPFVYLYHLAIFFFCSGYLYKDIQKDLTVFLAKKIKSLYWPATKHSLIALLLYNLYVKMGVVDSSYLSRDDVLIDITNILTLNGGGPLFVAYWFFQILLCSILIFGSVQYFSSKISNIYYKNIVFIVLVGVIGRIGIYSTEKHLGFLYNLQIAYLMVPILLIGYLYKKYMSKEKWEVDFSIILLIITFSILVHFIKNGIGIELSKYEIASAVLFYLISIIGILFCVSLAQIIWKCNKLTTVISYLGRNSLEIMIYHVVAFKMVDYLYFKLKGDVINISSIPYSCESLWPIYYVMGILVPLMIKKLLNSIVLLHKRRNRYFQ